MGLSIGPREQEGMLILDLTGCLTIGPEDVMFRTTIQRELAAGRTKIVRFGAADR